MTTVDLIIGNCKVVNSLGIKEAGLTGTDEKIVAITKNSHLPKAGEVIDARGNVVVRGGIDVHVHFMDLEYTRREDWKTGSMSAAAGGVTFVMGLPILLR